MTRERERLCEALDNCKRGLAKPPVLYRLGYVKRGHQRDGLMTFVASTEDEDRGNDVIRQSGWELDPFRNNPVYMWGHDYSRPPIGTVPRVWTEGRQLLNTVRFDKGDGFAAEVERKFRSGVLKAQSVGFRPLEFEERRGGGFEFTRSELLEISAVAIPMNAGALRRGVTSTEPSWLVRAAWSGVDDPIERLTRRLRLWNMRRGRRGRLTRSEALRIKRALRRVRTG
jgi:hypothetical protein